MFAYLSVDPGAMPIVQTGIVDQGELFAIAVRPQIRAPLQGQLPAVREREADHLAMVSGCGQAVGLGKPLVQFPEEFRVVLHEEPGTEQGQPLDRAGLNPCHDPLDIAVVKGQRGNAKVSRGPEPGQENVQQIGQVIPASHEGV
jgi:hypothetical protein